MLTQTNMPTQKQRAAFKEITENHRSVSEAMRSVGYSPSTASKPSNLTKSKGWKWLANKYIPDELLAQKHRELLDKQDSASVAKALDMAYKIKGYYAPEKHQNQNASISFKWTDEQVKSIAKRVLEKDNKDKSTVD